MTASQAAQKDVIEQLLERGYARVEDLDGDYSDDTARAVLRDLEAEDTEWVVRTSDRAHTWYLGRGLADLLWSNGQPVTMPREAIEIYEGDEQ